MPRAPAGTLTGTAVMSSSLSTDANEWEELRVRNRTGAELRGLLASAWLAASACCGALADTPAIAPASLPRIGTIDPRFQSYNIEMIEITGGRFWKPYRPEQGFLLAR